MQDTDFDETKFENELQIADDRHYFNMTAGSSQQPVKSSSQ